MHMCLIQDMKYICKIPHPETKMVIYLYFWPCPQHEEVPLPGWNPTHSSDNAGPLTR